MLPRISIQHILFIDAKFDLFDTTPRLLIHLHRAECSPIWPHTQRYGTKNHTKSKKCFLSSGSKGGKGRGRERRRKRVEEREREKEREEGGDKEGEVGKEGERRRTGREREI